MNAKKCDRCGKFFLLRAKHLDSFIRVQIREDEKEVFNDSHAMDLCDECLSSLWDWWRDRKGNNGDES